MRRRGRGRGRGGAAASAAARKGWATRRAGGKRTARKTRALERRLKVPPGSVRASRAFPKRYIMKTTVAHRLAGRVFGVKGR